VSARLSVCPTRSPYSAAAGFLLWARQAGDIDRLLAGAHHQPCRSTDAAANMGSATLSADVDELKKGQR